MVDQAKQDNGQLSCSQIDHASQQYGRAKRRHVAGRAEYCPHSAVRLGPKAIVPCSFVFVRWLLGDAHGTLTVHCLSETPTSNG